MHPAHRLLSKSTPNRARLEAALHAILARVADSYRLKDLNSTNGTQVNVFPDARPRLKTAREGNTPSKLHFSSTVTTEPSSRKNWPGRYVGLGGRETALPQMCYSDLVSGSLSLHRTLCASRCLLSSFVCPRVDPVISTCSCFVPSRSRIEYWTTHEQSRALIGDSSKG
jgi:hypothetical protein